MDKIYNSREIEKETQLIDPRKEGKVKGKNKITL